MTDLAEARFTPASKWCAHPEWWHSPDNMATENEVSDLVGALVRATQPELVVETGAYRGHTSRAIGRALRDNGHGRLDAIELNPELTAQVEMAVAGLPVNVICNSSMGYTPPEPIGFAFLDSEIYLRPREVDRFWPHLQDGALVVVHDTAPHHLAGRSNWLEYLSHGMPALNLRTPRGLLVFQCVR